MIFSQILQPGILVPGKKSNLDRAVKLSKLGMIDPTLKSPEILSGVYTDLYK